MAIFLVGMDQDETIMLTEAMVNSGEKVCLDLIDGTKVDKHSTGGVGDKTTLVVAPIVAACGIPVAKMSGRGLGHTGGTIDKLESIPGFNTALSLNDFISCVNKIGIAIAGQTGNLAPADKKLYALRDVTATVDNYSLIASSIMSKKLASGADAIVLDVKVGSGAFMKDIDDAALLAKTMVDIGNNTGKKTTALLTNMDTPLGNTVGNNIEVIEAIETLKGNGPKDLEELCLTLSAKMLEATNLYDKKQSYNKVKTVLESTAALQKLEQLIESQGGNSKVVNDYNIFKKPQYEFECKSEKTGYISNIKTDHVGVASMHLGAGRAKKGDSIDMSAGIRLLKKTGDYVNEGETLAILYTDNKNSLTDASKTLIGSYNISSQKPTINKIILDCIE